MKIKNKRCILEHCNKLADNNGLCKFHKCRCREFYKNTSKTFTHGCLIHG